LGTAWFASGKLSDLLKRTQSNVHREARRCSRKQSPTLGFEPEVNETSHLVGKTPYPKLQIIVAVGLLAALLCFTVDMGDFGPNR
jgi:ElaB/YqjD/DUF883 family membrane-anchored ribosome-binding protein